MAGGQDNHTINNETTH